MKQNIYKNYRSKVSSPLIYQLEKYEIVRRNPRLIGRVIKFLGYTSFLQSQSKKIVKMGNPGENSALISIVPSIIDLSKLSYYSNNLHTSYHSYIFTSNLYQSNLSPNYSTEKASFLTIFEHYYLKIATIHWTKRREILGEKYYAEVINILIELGIIYCDFKKWAGERCYGFAITEYGHNLLVSSQKEYFYQKIYDPKEKRNLRDRIKKSGIKNKCYADPLLQRIKSNIDGIDNIEELHDISLTLPDNANVVSHYLLDSIREGDYPDLEVHPLTKRVYSYIHMLPKKIKKSAVINGKSLAASIDVRSCHPTFLGAYIGLLAVDWYGEIEESLRREIESYTALFCHKTNHPRQVIKDQIERDYNVELDDLKAVKNGLNHFINGCADPIPRLFRKWLKDNYPTIYALWRKTDISQTGNNIAKIFEFDIFRQQEVIEKAESMGLILTDNHDELLIFGSKPKTKQFLKWFKGRAVSVTGIDVYFSVDFEEREAKAA